ncbi:adenylate/guanylate cyclase domain-containing protein [Larkinella bovis]|uniref:Adenylate/guanylate cyclase domain-containing protein n=1 Tax=Larkinella bovis TaxID=683041 RepID=A0ABW0IH83_9BACT
MNRRIRLVMLLLLMGCQVVANPVRITDLDRTYDVFGASQMLGVKAGTVSIDDLLRNPATYQFVNTEKQRIKPYNQQLGYWFRFELVNQQDREVFLQFIYAGTERIVVYETAGNRVLALHRLGSLQPEPDQPFRKSVQFCPIAAKNGQTSTFYVYMEGIYTSALPIFALSVDKLLERQHRSDLFYGTYYGFILIIIVYSLVMFIRLGEWGNLRYAVWVLFIGLQMALFRGHTSEFFWPANPGIEAYATALAAITGFLHVLFTLSFLRLRIQAPTFYKIGIGIMILYAIGFVVNVANVSLNHQLGEQIDFVPLLALFEGLVSIAAGVVTLRKGFRPALFYIAGNLFFYVGILVFLLYTFGRLPYSFWTFESIHLGVGVEILFFAVALTYKVNLIDKQRKDAEQEKIRLLQENERLVTEQNTMLEQKVQQRTEELQEAKQRSEELLLNILPSEVVEELKQTGQSKPRRFERVTVLFTDIKNFTQMGEQLSPEDLVNEIDYYYRSFDAILSRFRIEKIKTIGDAYLCAGGLPVAYPDNPVEVVKAAIEMRDFMLHNQQDRVARGFRHFEFRIGIHTGPVVAGIVGVRKFAYDIWGDTVNTAARMEQHGEVGKINISDTTYQLVKEHFQCNYRGKIAVKNKGDVDMYFAEERVEKAVF